MLTLYTYVINDLLQRRYMMYIKVHTYIQDYKQHF